MAVVDNSKQPKPRDDGVLDEVDKMKCKRLTSAMGLNLVDGIVVTRWNRVVGCQLSVGQDVQGVRRWKLNVGRRKSMQEDWRGIYAFSARV